MDVYLKQAVLSFVLMLVQMNQVMIWLSIATKRPEMPLAMLFLDGCVALLAAVVWVSEKVIWVDDQ